MTPEARAARERKQKIFVVVGGLFLVGMLAIQLPKLLGGSSSPAAAPATTTEATDLPAQPSTVAPVPLVGATPTAESAKLTSFSVFTPKDPFVQQVVTPSPAAAAAAAGKPAEKGAGRAAKPPTKKFETGTTVGAAATIVNVNGAQQVLQPGTKFPSADPLFVLVAEKPDSKSVVVGIVGGVYSGGAKTTTLKVGKPLTLVNTTTGAKYRISLVSVGSGGAVAPAAPTP